MSHFVGLINPPRERPGDPIKDPKAVARGHAAMKSKRERRFPQVPNPWGLTGAEWAVLTAMLETGDQWSDIGARLFMASKTASTHVQRAREKMGAKTTMHAVLLMDRWIRAEKIDLELVVRFIDGKPSVEMRPTHTSIRVQESQAPQETVQP